MQRNGWGRLSGLAAVLLVSANAAIAETLVEAGAFQKIYDPAAGEAEEWYINDHCFVQREGTWHLFGITNYVPIVPYNEDQLAHATAQSLTQPQWEKRPFALRTDASQGETHLWAPCVVERDGVYYMFYCAGGTDRTAYGMHLATSTDLETWTRYPGNPLFRDGFEARDSFVVNHDGQWIMYYTATTTPERGNYSVAYRTSPDLEHWSERKIAYADPKSGSMGGNAESPFVVRRGSRWYLFIGPRGRYVATEVFVSDSPFHFENADLAGQIPAHAAEVVRDVEGSWYVSHCGWRQGGVYLAPLRWLDGLDNADTSVEVPRE